MADWKDNLRPASFRGVTFHTETHGGDSGRRWANHEYPGRDLPYAEDMGRSQRTWKFSGYLIGDDYPVRRALLVKACEAAGPGELIHPTIGLVRAVCRTVSHSEARDRGRYVAFNFEFAEAGQLREPTGFADYESIVAAAALALGTVAKTNLTKRYTTHGGGSYLTQASTEQIVSLSATLQRARHPAPGVDQGALNRALEKLAKEAVALSADPPALADATDSAFAEYTDAGEAMPVTSTMLILASPHVFHWLPSDLSSENLTPPAEPALRGTFVGGGATVRLPVVQQRRINLLSYDSFTRYLALREVGYAVPGLAFDNYDDAMALLDTVAQAFIVLEWLAADAGDDDIYQALAGLRAEITHLIRARAANLTPLIHYRRVGPTAPNSLAFAWRMYQDSSRDLEVVERTRTRSPAYMPFTGRVLAA